MRTNHFHKLLAVGALVLTACPLTSCKVLRIDELKQKNEDLERYSMILELEEQGVDETTPEPRELTKKEQRAARKIQKMREKEQLAAQPKEAPRYLTRPIARKRLSPGEVTADSSTKPAAQVAEATPAKAKPSTKATKKKPAPQTPTVVAEVTEPAQPEPVEIVEQDPMILPAGEDAEVLVDIPGLVPVDKKKKPFAKDPVDEVGLYPEE